MLNPTIINYEDHLVVHIVIMLEIFIYSIKIYDKWECKICRSYGYQSLILEHKLELIF